VEHQPKDIKKKKDKADLVQNRMYEEDMSESDEDDWEDPINYLEIVRMALIDTRRILETFDEDGNVYN
jgi:hypothetical protein